MDAGRGPGISWQGIVRSAHYGVMATESDIPGLDTSRPNIARVYDWWLGGRENFAADRAVAANMAEINPALVQMVRDNRTFVCAAVARAAEAGIRQFLDLGSGLPTQPSVHEAVQKVSPDARVCYVDRDTVAAVHARALLASGAGLAAAEADLTRPGEVFAHPGVTHVIDPARPMCVILAAVLHFYDTVAAQQVAAEYASLVPAGSWLVVSVGHYEDLALHERMRAAFPSQPFRNHGAADIAAWLEGLDLVSPGIAEAKRWVTGVSPAEPPGRPAYTLCAAAIKP
jgi:O-methyltransferase involved in polyketide biosynthesis